MGEGGYLFMPVLIHAHFALSQAGFPSRKPGPARQSCRAGSLAGAVRIRQHSSLARGHRQAAAGFSWFVEGSWCMTFVPDDIQTAGVASSSWETGKGHAVRGAVEGRL